MGEKHFKVLSQYLEDKIEISGILNSTPESSRQKAQKLGVPFFNTVEEINKSNTDMVIIATPAAFHAFYAKKMLAQGIDVLLEKPFAANEKECLEIIKAAGESKASLLIGYTEIFNPAVIAAKEALAGHRIVKAEAYRSTLSCGSNTDVTIVQNLMSHDISVINALSGQTAEEIKGIKTFAHPEKDMCSYAKAEVAFNDGMQVSMIAECAPEGPFRTMKIIDEAQNNYEINFLKRSLHKNGKLLCEGGNSLENELRHFYACHCRKAEPAVNCFRALEIEQISLRIDTDFRRTSAAKSKLKLFLKADSRE